MKWPYERRRLQCGVGAPRRPLDRVVYETEGPQDLDDGVFDITRYVTPRNQAGDSGLRSGPSSSSRAPQGATGLAPGTSLTLWCMRQRVLLQFV
ncbi:hypothetical protein ANAPC1_00819 [Anaplasma phagocytophilum]|uniref:Uncharacterized protein n=1 Tax=Anaplasma phagocytophilum TaxID=948 RepID=A0AA45UTD5_ANAPH|nr:hypothetical protein ANAPC1_00819 [Anaplasma phagocytophilum]